jgi:fatty-acyl-CoA synthase
VADVAVVGLPDEIWGELPVAFVVPSVNGSTLEEGDIVEHCRRQLPRYKTIRGVHFLPSLPKTSSGKTKRAELREAWQSASVGDKR